VIANALNVSGADNESEEKDYQPHCFPVAASRPPALLPHRTDCYRGRSVLGVASSQGFARIMYLSLAVTWRAGPAEYVREAPVALAGAFSFYAIQPSSLALSAAAWSAIGRRARQVLSDEGGEPSYVPSVVHAWRQAVGMYFPPHLSPADAALQLQ
jgi:hypothetical protein